MFQPGLTLGKYELGSKLGEGGFGFVYVARDSGLDRDVALKFLRPEHTSNPHILQRFLQEARSAAKIVHPGIVTVFECGQIAGTNTAADGTAYIAMELLHGESLSDRLAGGAQISPAAALEICRQVASALAAAHKAGIIHRDLKPDNVFIVEDPAMPTGERVKVLDFGIAKLAQAATSSVQTGSMMVFGTPLYMSPEQCRSAAHIDHRSDIYTLGCILFELVCGRPPFDGEPGELIAKHQLVPPPEARALVSTLPPAIDRLIALMLAKDPLQRPQTMAAVQRACEEAGTAAIAGVAPTLLPGASSSIPRAAPQVASPTTLSSATGSTLTTTRSSKLPWIVIGGLLVAGGVVLAITLSHRGSSSPVQAGDPRLATSAPDAAPVIVDAALLDATVIASVDSTVIDAAMIATLDAGVGKPAKVVVLTSAAVTARVQAYAASIRACYDTYTRTHSSLGGRLGVVAHVVDGKASVVANGIAPEVEVCVAGLANGWQFPIPTDRKPVDASASFNFPAGGKQTVVPCNPIKDHVVDPFAKNPCPS